MLFARRQWTESQLGSITERTLWSTVKRLAPSSAPAKLPPLQRPDGTLATSLPDQAVLLISVLFPSKKGVSTSVPQAPALLDLTRPAQDPQLDGEGASRQHDEVPASHHLMLEGGHDGLPAAHPLQDPPFVSSPAPAPALENRDLPRSPPPNPPRIEFLRPWPSSCGTGKNVSDSLPDAPYSVVLARRRQSTLPAIATRHHPPQMALSRRDRAPPSSSAPLERPPAVPAPRSGPALSRARPPNAASDAPTSPTSTSDPLKAVSSSPPPLGASPAARTPQAAHSPRSPPLTPSTLPLLPARLRTSSRA